MKVVQINTFPNGSTGKIAMAIHRALLSNGNESFFYYGIGKTDKKANCYCFESKLSVHIHSFLSRLTGLQGYYSFFATKKLINSLKKIKPDIVHLHNYHGSYLNLGLFLKYIAKNDAKLFITLHDCCLFTGKCPHFVKVSCYKWKDSCKKCPQLKRYPTSWFFDFSSYLFRKKKKWLYDCKHIHIVTVSKWLDSVASQSYLNRFPMTQIYNGIDYNDFYPRRKPTVLLKPFFFGKKIILGVGTIWSNNKGLDSILAMSKQLKSDEVFVLVGLTPEQIKELPHNVFGIKRTDSINELCELYSAASVFVTLSLEETFGLVVVEALACGTPCVAYDSTALSELIKDGYNGYLVPPNRLDLFLEAIRKAMLLKGSFRIENGETNNFSAEKMTESYLNLYKKELI